jgi:hypothetical protein
MVTKLHLSWNRAVRESSKCCGISLQSANLSGVILLHIIRNVSGKRQRLRRAWSSINGADCLAVKAKWDGSERLDSLVNYSGAPVAVSSSLAKHSHMQLYPVIPH